MTVSGVCKDEIMYRVTEQTHRPQTETNIHQINKQLVPPGNYRKLILLHATPKVTSVTVTNNEKRIIKHKKNIDQPYLLI